MRTLLLLLFCSCGGVVPSLAEGLYVVTLIETSNTCNWPNGDVVRVGWDISKIDHYYGLKQTGNGETLACTEGSEKEDFIVTCYKEKVAMVGDCEWTVVQTVIMDPMEEEFIGTYQADYTSCKNEICSQHMVIKGEPYTDWY